MKWAVNAGTCFSDVTHPWHLSLSISHALTPAKAATAAIADSALNPEPPLCRLTALLPASHSECHGLGCQHLHFVHKRTRVDLMACLSARSGHQIDGS